MMSSHLMRGSRRRQASTRHHSTLEAICIEKKISSSTARLDSCRFTGTKQKFSQGKKGPTWCGRTARSMRGLGFAGSAGHCSIMRAPCASRIEERAADFANSGRLGNGSIIYRICGSCQPIESLSVKVSEFAHTCGRLISDHWACL